MKAQHFAIRGEHIELHQLLKATGFSESGAAAKQLIDTGAVRVDGAQELRRRRKIRPGQRVDVTGADSAPVLCSGQTPDASPRPAPEI